MEGMKYAYMGLGAGMVILCFGALFFRDSEDALQVTVLVAFAVAFALNNGLYERARRRKRRGQ